ncbi:DUF4393 domain-containing protein [Psychrobacter faecalis]|uniref:DUF4393 domain-containing protein n=1 Tax=Psychrobacter faecalis TaxID=180588 RepID=UPI001917B0B7|nr:DUF4393 domain-containing protein [Psychrobacter faecalis]
MEKGIVKAVLETSNNILLEVYGDLLKPGVSQVGQAIGTLLGYGNTILMPLALKNEKSKITIQSNLNKYRQKLEEISEENIQSVVPEIGVPILEKLMYVSDETLVELYTELLAKASDKEQCESTHPSFVNIINNLSPKEVKILELIYEKHLAIVSVNVIADDSSHPVEQISELILDVDIYDENATAHISNLIGLGLIDMNFNVQFSAAQRYERLEEIIKETYSNAPTELKDVEIISHFMKGNVSFSRGTIEISSFGGLFLKACTKNRKKTELFNLFSRL